jgi:hypothetical protein
MASGFQGLLAWLFRWPSGLATVGGPYRVVEAEVFSTGSVAGEVFLAGRAAGEVFSTGVVAGEIDGRSS